MSTDDQTADCCYTFNPAEEADSTKASTTETWECPHEVYSENKNRCIFHLQPEERNKINKNE